MTDHFENTFFGASQNIFENARTLRKKATDAEKKLWEKLRNRKLRNLKFRRQHPVYKYVADFYCAEHKVIVELDGGIHQLKNQKEYDQERTNELEKLGIRVIRFTNEDVMLNINETLKKIERFIFVKVG
jgi:very-short-patch-repair endonuclease